MGRPFFTQHHQTFMLLCRLFFLLMGAWFERDFPFRWEVLHPDRTGLPVKDKVAKKKVKSFEALLRKR